MKVINPPTPNKKRSGLKDFTPNIKGISISNPSYTLSFIKMKRRQNPLTPFIRSFTSTVYRVTLSNNPTKCQRYKTLKSHCDFS